MRFILGLSTVVLLVAVAAPWLLPISFDIRMFISLLALALGLAMVTVLATLWQR